MSIPDCLPNNGLGHRFELKTYSSSMTGKDKQLLYDLIERLLFTSKITVPDVYACVSYIITRMELLSLTGFNVR